MEDKQPEEKKKSEVYAEQADQAFEDLKPDLEAMKKKYEAVKEELVGMGKFAAKLFNFAKAKVSQKGMEAFEAVEAQYEAAKEEIDARYQGFQEVGKTSRNQTEKIKSARSALDKKSEKFTERETERSESSVLSGAAKVTKGFNKAMTLFGSTAAKVAKTPDTLAARWAALKGDKEGADARLGNAETKATGVMNRVKAAVEKTEKGIQGRITSYNRVERRTARQDTTIETKTNDTLDRVDDFVETQENNGTKRGVIANIMGVNHAIRAYTGNIEAQLARMGYDALAKGSAIIGMDRTAQELSRKGGRVSNDIMDRVDAENTREQADFSDRMEAYDSVGARTDAKIGAINRKAESVNEKTEEWKENHESKGFMSDGIRAITGAITQGITGATKLYAKGDMRATEVAAKVAALLGFSDASKEMVTDARKRATENMEGAEKINKAVRTGADATMSFKDRRKAEVVRFGQQIEQGVKDGIAFVGTGIEKGVDAVERGVQTGVDFVVDTARDVKSDVQIAANKVSERYHRGNKGFFTALKNGSTAVLTSIANSMLAVNEVVGQKLDDKIKTSDRMAIAASENASRIEESKNSNEPKETNKKDDMEIG